MARVLYGWAANMAGLLLADLLQLVTYNGRFLTLAAAALAFGIVNVLIRPVITVLSLPAIVLTFGLFIFVINALMLWLTDIVVPNFEVFTFWRTIGAAVVVGLTNFVLHGILKDITREDKRAA